MIRGKMHCEVIPADSSKWSTAIGKSANGSRKFNVYNSDVLSSSETSFRNNQRRIPLKDQQNTLQIVMETTKTVLEDMNWYEHYLFKEHYRYLSSNQINNVLHCIDVLSAKVLRLRNIQNKKYSDKLKDISQT